MPAVNLFLKLSGQHTQRASSCIVYLSEMLMGRASMKPDADGTLDINERGLNAWHNAQKPDATSSWMISFQ